MEVSGGSRFFEAIKSVQSCSRKTKCKIRHCLHFRSCSGRFGIWGRWIL